MGKQELEGYVDFNYIQSLDSGRIKQIPKELGIPRKIVNSIKNKEILIIGWVYSEAIGWNNSVTKSVLVKLSDRPNDYKFYPLYPEFEREVNNINFNEYPQILV